MRRRAGSKAGAHPRAGRGNRVETAHKAVLGIVGWSGSGKTSLVRRLLHELVGRGISVSTIKHAHAGFDIDTPGKDSHVHREAGACEVVVSSVNRFALIHENRNEPEPRIAGLLARMAPVDLVLIEGFKSEPHDKLEVHRPAVGKPALYPRDPDVIALATDEEAADARIPVLDLNDTAAIADFIVSHCGLRPATEEVA